MRSTLAREIDAELNAATDGALTYAQRRELRRIIDIHSRPVREAVALAMKEYDGADSPLEDELRAALALLNVEDK